MAKSKTADVGVLPKSKQPALDVAGINDTGYLDKKGTPHGASAHFNALPPGMNIEDQEVTDQRSMELKTVTGLSYPGDGWT